MSLIQIASDFIFSKIKMEHFFLFFNKKKKKKSKKRVLLWIIILLANSLAEYK